MRACASNIACNLFDFFGMLMNYIHCHSFGPMQIHAGQICKKAGQEKEQESGLVQLARLLIFIPYLESSKLKQV
jgi:hypothetical protein